MITGTASVALLYTEIVSSSVIYSSGSNQFGDASNDVQTLYGTFNVVNGPSNFTGSVNISGSTTISGSLNVSGSVTGNVLGNNTDTYTGSAPIQQVVTLTAAEYTAISASANANTLYVISDSTAFNPSTFATTGSNTFNGNQIISGSLTVTGAITGSIVSASYAVNATTASYADSGFKVGQLTIRTPGVAGNDSTIIGKNAGFYLVNDTNSTLIGSEAGFNLTGNDNVAVGYQALYDTTTGNNNTAVGTGAALQINAGSGNVAVGHYAMYTFNDFPSNANAAFNTVVGNSAAKKLYFGDNNTVIGSLTGQLLSTGSNNTIIGANYSGSDFNNTVVLTDGQGNVQFYATGGLATLTNITASSISSTFTGSLLGTASFATTAVTASYATNALSASYATDALSASIATSASYATNALSASYATNALSSSFATFALGAGAANSADSASQAISSSYATNALSASIATTASFYDLSAVTQNAVFSGSVRGDVSALSISSNTSSLDLSTGNFFTLQLISGSNTFVNPSNILPGQTINLRIIQPDFGFGTVSFPSSVKQVSGSSYVPTAAALAQDIVTFISFDASSLYLSNVKNLI